MAIDMEVVSPTSTTTPADQGSAGSGAQLSREQIMAVTARCLHEVGYDRTTIRKIASTLGCAIGSIYRYFTDKRELLNAVTQQRLDPVADLAQSASAGAGSFEASLRMYQQRAVENPQDYRLMFWLSCLPTDAGQSPVGSHRLPAVVQRIVEGWASHLQDAALARQVWSLLHGSITLGQHSPQVIDNVLRMVAARAVLKQANAARAAARVEPAAAVAAAVLAPVAADAAVEDVCLL